MRQTTLPKRIPISSPLSPSPIPMGEGWGEGSSLLPSPPQLDTLSADDERFPFFTAAQLNSGQFETRYLVPGILAAGQPGGIFGAFKTLKTSITADLLISLASGTPFLGHFAVPEPGRALFLSGESGLAALQSIARRICAARGIDLDALDNFELSPKLPNLDSPDDVKILGRILRRKKPACVAIDPAYLAIRGEDARNLFAMGSLLRPLAELCDETGAAILIVHHCKRTRIVPGDPATLDDIAWAGFAEFAAQWLLLARRRRYDPDTGHHELWFTAGGRAGHHGLCALDVDEGRSRLTSASSVEPPDGTSASGTSPASEGSARQAEPTEGRIWKTTIRPVRTAETQSEVRQMEASEDRRIRRSSVAFQRDCHRALAVLESASTPVSAGYLREILSLNGQRMKRVLARFLGDGVAARVPQFSGSRPEMVYSLTPSYRDSLRARLQAAAEPAEKRKET